MNSSLRSLSAELVGTFFLVFAGTGAIVANDLPGHPLGHVGVALSFGLVVLALVYALGEVSGAHLNPAVTLGFVAAGRFPVSALPGYVAGQLGGAFLASGLLRLLFPEHPALGATRPSGPALQSLVFETVLTWFLMLVVLRISTGANEKGITAGLVVGSVIGLEALFGGPVSGASMNPARSVAPAVVSGHLENLWIYLAGPVVGALLAVPTDRLLGSVSAPAKSRSHSDSP